MVAAPRLHGRGCRVRALQKVARGWLARRQVAAARAAGAAATAVAAAAAALQAHNGNGKRQPKQQAKSKKSRAKAACVRQFAERALAGHKLRCKAAARGAAAAASPL